MAKHLISSNATIKAIKAGDPRSRLNDGDGLCLLLFVKGGSHSWRFDYTFDGRRKTLSFGTYPDTTLSLAKRKADEARQLVRDGIDPSAARRAAKKESERKRKDDRPPMRARLRSGKHRLDPCPAGSSSVQNTANHNFGDKA